MSEEGSEVTWHICDPFCENLNTLNNVDTKTLFININLWRKYKE